MVEKLAQDGGVNCNITKTQKHDTQLVKRNWHIAETHTLKLSSLSTLTTW